MNNVVPSLPHADLLMKETCNIRWDIICERLTWQSEKGEFRWETKEIGPLTKEEIKILKSQGYVVTPIFSLYNSSPYHIIKWDRKSLLKQEETKVNEKSK